MLVSLIVALHYPLQLNPARKSTLSLVKFLRKDGERVLSRREHSFRYNLVTVSVALFKIASY